MGGFFVVEFEVVRRDGSGERGERRERGLGWDER